MRDYQYSNYPPLEGLGEVKIPFLMKKILNTFIILLIPIGLAGQLKPVTDQYMLNPMSINPAFAGNRGALNIAAFYRQQWVGINGAPETMTLASDAPLLDAKLGVGLIIERDKIGVTKETSFNSNYAYKIKVGKGNLSFGLGAGLITTNTAYSDLVALQPGDEFYQADSKVYVVPDFSFGLYYTLHNYFAGFSIPELLSYNFNSDKNKYSPKALPGQYYYLFNTGYLIEINSKIKFLPSTLISFSPNEKILYDINAHFNFMDKLWAGISYRNNRSIAGLFQYQINNQLRVAYSYNVDFGKLSTYSNGSHEIMLRYEFRYKTDVVNPLIF
jgi:type IX secretion system PorP/SprF family membrane protein